MKQLRTMRYETKTKYYRLIHECFALKEFDIETLRKRHHVGRNIFTAMQQCNVITVKKSRATWVGAFVTDLQLNEIYATYEKIQRKDQAAALLRKNKINPNQIAIKPQQPIAQPSPIINPSPIEKAHVTPTHHAEINTEDRALRNAFIAGVVIGVLISCAIAAMW